ncbi:hypothetical protein AB0D37_42430 [Streptomyces sp. NPDC048384]|uniref:hypothetical protein n=1 Tax=Streptomyces sp. NPDC048384 TaxID=3155487 RepID=UPI00342C37E5
MDEADHDPWAVAGTRSELVGGPLDGLLLDVTGSTHDEIGTSVLLQTALGQYGPDGRTLYEPRPGDPSRFDWTGDSPQ